MSDKIGASIAAFVERLADVPDMHSARLLRGLHSHAAFLRGERTDVLHALSRYGVWARGLADAIRAGELTPLELEQQLRLFASIQNELSFEPWLDDGDDGLPEEN